jgi:hypothetical protein
VAVYQGARRPALGLDLSGLSVRRGRSGNQRRKAAHAAREGGWRPRTQARSMTVAGSIVAGARRRGAARARRASRVGIVLTAIVFVFAAAFLSLSQSVRVAATSYDIVRLGAEQDSLDVLRRDARSDLERLRSAPAIRKGAVDLGLGQLSAPIVIPAR